MQDELVRRAPVPAWLLATLGPPALTAALAPTLGPAHATNVAFAYLVVVLGCAVLGGVGPGGVASVNAFLLFNFFFIEPLHSFSVGTPTDVGVLVGFLVTALVVSGLLASLERRRDEAERVHVLQETDRQRSALLAAVSHDLRTPLAAMTAAAGALDDDGLPPSERATLARSIVVEGERLDRMVRNLLDLGRIEGGALAAQREVVPVDELIGVVLTRVRPRLGARRLTLDVPADLPAVLVDPVQIDQVLGNLVENAMTHTPDEAGLQVRARADGSWVTIRVADRGPGVPEDERDAMFDRFVRGRTKQSGSGLGLAIARAYTTANGGTLAYAANGTGSAFDLRLVAVE